MTRFRIQGGFAAFGLENPKIARELLYNKGRQLTPIMAKANAADKGATTSLLLFISEARTASISITNVAPTLNVIMSREATPSTTSVRSYVIAEEFIRTLL
jgi:hypothetical protein